jgi:hypothetical protein
VHRKKLADLPTGFLAEDARDTLEHSNDP